MNQIHTLVTLVLSHNQISFIPILHCQQLRILDLRENKFDHSHFNHQHDDGVINLSYMIHLQQIFLSFNQLQNIKLIFFNSSPTSSSSSLSSSSIVELHLSNCSLVSLPEDIGLLVNLHSLDISNNELTDLPLLRTISSFNS